MSKSIFPSFCLTLALGVSCNNSSIDRGGECVEGTRGCDPAPDPVIGGPGLPDRVDKIGVGQATGFDPKDGSTGVKKDDKGNIVLDPGNFAGMKPIIWVANSAEGTVSKIDTRTVKEIARYRTSPGAGDPSRTTVGLNGDVVVANRGGGSAVKIAGDISGCVDKNGNGKIDTSAGAGTAAALAWGSDECVQWWTDLRVNGSSPYPRAAGFDAGLGELGGINVYIGLYMTSEVLRINAVDGKILKRIPVTGRPYGLVIDSEGGVVVQSSGPIVRINPKNNDEVKTLGTSPCPYGIAADSRGYIYTSGNSGSSACVSRMKVTGGAWETLSLSGQGATFPRGLAVDQKNQVWVTDTTYGMIHVDASGAAMTVKGRSKIASTYSVGAAIDFDGNPWLISQSNSQAYKLDPASDATNYTTQGVALGGTASPYTYSDMTGFQLRNATGAGFYRHTFPGCGPQTRWFDLTWDISAPVGTEVTVRVRFAATVAELQAAAWTQIAKVQPDKSPVRLAVPAGARPDVLQVEIGMRSADTKITPILSGLGVGYSCNILG